VELPPGTEFDIDWDLPWLVAAGYNGDDLVWFLQRLMDRDWVYN
jgi:hypothetical protein